MQHVTAGDVRDGWPASQVRPAPPRNGLPLQRRSPGATRAGCAGAGRILALIREGRATSRAELQDQTGLARSTLAHRVDKLIAHGLVSESRSAASTGGRPPMVLTFNPAAGVMLAADIGAHVTLLAVTHLAGKSLEEAALAIDVAEGPEMVLTCADRHLRSLLAEIRAAPPQVRGIGVGLPRAVACRAGEGAAVRWPDFSVHDWFRSRYDAPVVSEDRTAMMAYGEHRATWRDAEHLLFVRFGATVTCGIIAGGKIDHGADGAAGEIGHIRVPGNDALCRCGNTGCLDAVAGGGALARHVAAHSVPAERLTDVVHLAEAGSQTAIAILRQAGRHAGEVLAWVVDLFGPDVVVIGGPLGNTDMHVLAGVRELIHQRSAPIATRHLRTVASRLGERAGVAGVASAIAEHVLVPAMIDRYLG